MCRGNHYTIKKIVFLAILFYIIQTAVCPVNKWKAFIHFTWHALQPAAHRRPISSRSRAEKRCACSLVLKRSASGTRAAYTSVHVSCQHQPAQRSSPLPLPSAVTPTVTAHDVALTGTLSCGVSVTRSAWLSEYASMSSFSGAVKPMSSSITHTCSGTRLLSDDSCAALVTVRHQRQSASAWKPHAMLLGLVCTPLPPSCQWSGFS